MTVILTLNGAYEGGLMKEVIDILPSNVTGANKLLSETNWGGTITVIC